MSNPIELPEQNVDLQIHIDGALITVCIEATNPTHARAMIHRVQSALTSELPVRLQSSPTVIRGLRIRAGAKLAHSNLVGARLYLADLAGADLFHAKLIGANLSKADLREADLREATLIGAHLFQADLSGANISGADLTDADMQLAKVDGLVWDEYTKWPHRNRPAIITEAREPVARIAQ